MGATRCVGQTVLLAVLGFAASAQCRAAANPFVPEQVFAGRSEGTGELRLLLGKARPFKVVSSGTVQKDGRLTLGQQVHFQGKPVQSRSWVMWPLAQGRYAATLTEAAGPVVVRTSGNRLTLRYPLTHWGLVMHQTLDLMPNHQTVMNYGSIRFLGMEVGRLRETIQLKH